MDKIFEAKEYLLKFYAKYSRYVDMGFRFIMALLTFLFISNHVGFLEVLANPTVTIGLSLICAFLPMTMTVVIAIVIVLVQFYTLAPGVAIVSGLMLLIMFVLYFRFTPGNSVVLLLTPVSFMLKIPVLVPLVFGLIGGPVCAVPVAFGILVYYMITYVKSYATVIETVASTGTMSQITTYMQQLFSSKEMWLVMISFTICLLLVYNIRRMSVDYAWEVASVVGIFVNLILMTFGHIMLDVKVDYVDLVVGSLIALLIALLLKVFVFSVDYSRSEYLQFEDDEYYYYVKAIPKVSMTVREKTVKKINIRQETEAIDSETVKKALDESNAKEMKETAEERKKRQKQEDSEIQRLIEEELNK